MTLLFPPAELGAGLAGGHWGPPGQVVAVVEGAEDHGVPAGNPGYTAQGTQEGQQPGQGGWAYPFKTFKTSMYPFKTSKTGGLYLPILIIS